MHAALILESNGYQNLYNVEDGCYWLETSGIIEII